MEPLKHPPPEPNTCTPPSSESVYIARPLRPSGTSASSKSPISTSNTHCYVSRALTTLSGSSLSRVDVLSDPYSRVHSTPCRSSRTPLTRPVPAALAPATAAIRTCYCFRTLSMITLLIRWGPSIHSCKCEAGSCKC